MIIRRMHSNCFITFSITPAKDSKCPFSINNEDLLTTGNGGDAGRQTLYVKKTTGKIRLKTCRGDGAQAAINGLGGTG